MATGWVIEVEPSDGGICCPARAIMEMLTDMEHLGMEDFVFRRAAGQNQG